MIVELIKNAALLLFENVKKTRINLVLKNIYNFTIKRLKLMDLDEILIKKVHYKENSLYRT